MEMGP